MTFAQLTLTSRGKLILAPSPTPSSSARPEYRSAPPGRRRVRPRRCARRTSAKPASQRLWTGPFPGFPAPSARRMPGAASRNSANLCIPRPGRCGKSLQPPFRQPGYLYLPRTESLMSCAKAGIIRRCAPDAMCLVPATQNGGPKAAVWVNPWRLHQSAKHFLGFAALGFAALGQHFGKDIPRAIRIAHVDIGLGEVQLGGDFIGAGEEVEFRLITTQRRVFGGEGRFDRRTFQALGQTIEFGVDVIQFRGKRIG